MLLGCSDAFFDRLDANYVVGKRVELGGVFHGLAAMLLDDGTARCANGELPMDVVEGENKAGAGKELNQTLKEKWSRSGRGLL